MGLLRALRLLRPLRLLSTLLSTLSAIFWTVVLTIVSFAIALLSHLVRRNSAHGGAGKRSGCYVPGRQVHAAIVFGGLLICMSLPQLHHRVLMFGLHSSW